MKSSRRHSSNRHIFSFLPSTRRTQKTRPKKNRKILIILTMQNLRTNDNRQYRLLPKFFNLIQGNMSCGNHLMQFTHGTALVDRKSFQNTPSKRKKLELRGEILKVSKIIIDHILNHSIHLRRHLLIRAAVEISTERSKI